MCRLPRRSIDLSGSSPNDRFSLPWLDRKSTRLNSSHSQISYAVFCLKKKTHIRVRFEREGAYVDEFVFHLIQLQVRPRARTSCSKHPIVFAFGISSIPAVCAFHVLEH